MYVILDKTKYISLFMIASRILVRPGSKRHPRPPPPFSAI